MKKIKTFRNLKVGDFVLFVRKNEPTIKWIGIVKENNKERVRMKYYALFIYPQNSNHEEGYCEEGNFTDEWFSDSGWKAYQTDEKEKIPNQKLIMLYELDG